MKTKFLLITLLTLFAFAGCVVRVETKTAYTFTNNGNYTITIIPDAGESWGTFSISPYSSKDIYSSRFPNYTFTVSGHSNIQYDITEYGTKISISYSDIRPAYTFKNSSDSTVKITPNTGETWTAFFIEPNMSNVLYSTTVPDYTISTPEYPQGEWVYYEENARDIVIKNYTMTITNKTNYNYPSTIAGTGLNLCLMTWGMPDTVANLQWDDVWFAPDTNGKHSAYLNGTTDIPSLNVGHSDKKVVPYFESGKYLYFVAIRNNEFKYYRTETMLNVTLNNTDRLYGIYNDDGFTETDEDGKDIVHIPTFSIVDETPAGKINGAMLSQSGTPKTIKLVEVPNFLN